MDKDSLGMRFGLTDIQSRLARLLADQADDPYCVVESST
jgi:hypothetical protein